MDNDLVDLIEKRKIPVFVIEEHLATRRIERGKLVAGIELLSAKMLPKPHGRVRDCLVLVATPCERAADLG